MEVSGVIPCCDHGVFRSRAVRSALDQSMPGGDHEIAVVYLLSSAASYVTGHDARVDGGWTVW